MRRLSLIALLIGLAGPVAAQIAASASALAAYDGLFRAALDGDVAGIERLVLEGADVDARNSDGLTPAHVAAFASEYEALRALAEAGADMNALVDGDYDIVMLAVVLDEPELMSLAIELGNDPGLAMNPSRESALIAAARDGHAELVRRLIDAGAPLDHTNTLRFTAVTAAVVQGDGGPDHQAVLDALLSAGADRSLADKYGFTPLQHAKMLGHTEMAKRLKRKN